jgi:phosphatidylinositol 4-kinase type 2
MMPRDRPPTTGYERLAQADRFNDDSDVEEEIAAGASLQPSSSGPRYASIIQPRPQAAMQPSASTSTAANVSRPLRTRQRASSGVDLKAINARLERWAEEIASKFKRGRGRKQGADEEDEEEERLEIQYSVFQAPDGVRPVTPEFLSKEEAGYMDRREFQAIVESVRVAIEQGVHPRMITQGSSGSYFAQNVDGKVVGVFKPKDEEPYAAGNPKWNKWIHRNLFPCCFGRAW